MEAGKSSLLWGSETWGDVTKGQGPPSPWTECGAPDPPKTGRGTPFPRTGGGGELHQNGGRSDFI